MKLLHYLTENYTLEEILSLTKLDCSGVGITSLEGIEKCTSLTNLWCYNNQLTSLKGIEGCTSLTKLYCSYNQLSSRSLYLSLKDLNIKKVNYIPFDKFISNLKIKALKETLNMVNKSF